MYAGPRGKPKATALGLSGCRAVNDDAKVYCDKMLIAAKSTECKLWIKKCELEAARGGQCL